MSPNEIHQIVSITNRGDKQPQQHQHPFYLERKFAPRKFFTDCQQQHQRPSLKGDDVAFFVPTLMCDSGCRASWSIGASCIHSVQPSNGCCDNCFDNFKKGQWCIHSRIRCSYCSKLTFPVTECLCKPTRLLNFRLVLALLIHSLSRH